MSTYTIVQLSRILRHLVGEQNWQRMDKQDRELACDRLREALATVYEEES